MKVPLLVIGGGLSGLAAAIRAARFVPDVLLVEKHSRPGGLNSYFYRNKTLYETGLHAITNYAEAENKSAPLNRLLRQLKLRRKDFTFCQQIQSEIRFPQGVSLRFSNDFQLLHSEIQSIFPNATKDFGKLLEFLEGFDPFRVCPFVSAKAFLLDMLKEPLLVDMLLCPLMYYGSSHEDDIDLNQFAIMFRAIYQEGMFRPNGSIKEFLNLLLLHYRELGGEIKLSSAVDKIICEGRKASRVILESGEELECQFILSTIGREETRMLIEPQEKSDANLAGNRLAFVETIYQLPSTDAHLVPGDKTIIFYNTADRFSYRIPEEPTDFSSGVICFPSNFQGIEKKPSFEVRSTHLANYHCWQKLSTIPDEYRAEKNRTSRRSLRQLENIIGSFQANIVYENSFTPVTIERYTSKIHGAIYGSPFKVKDGDIGFSNLFLAGTDQGFLGIIGSMLSGVSIVNQHILPKL